MPQDSNGAGAGPDEGAWAETPIDARLKVVRRLRSLLARDAEAFLADLAPRPPAQALLAEILPLADACRFLVREARAALRPRRLGAGGRPLWLVGHKAEVRREPFGRVLVIGPSNYPLLLPGVQAVQALAAGNAVLVKPAPGAAAPMARLGALLAEAGLPAGLLTVLDEDPAAAWQALEGDGRPDLVVLTGSVSTGRQVLERLASLAIPAIVELSGSDAVFLLPGADPGLAARAVAFGLRLNGGATCIAPRRVFVPPDLQAPFEAALVQALRAVPPAPAPPPVRERLRPLLAEAAAKGARFLPTSPDLDQDDMPPLAVMGAAPDWRLLQADVFAPVVAVVKVPDMEAALEADRRCPYALGAAVFGPPAEAEALARRVDAGTVTVNDLIAPTADPRLPFEGRRESGFGPTRGAEGLLALTRTKVITVRAGRFRPHYDPTGPAHLAAGLALLRATHGEGGRAKAVARLVGALRGLAGR
ncbi:MAG: aldehyde dehydrogenase family protein [Geminicoccaceae bacterium]|nr:aldehyde dehydrogenase family protein [Geminicoccaceae bacterium]